VHRPAHLHWRHAQLADRLLSTPQVSLLAEGAPGTGGGQARALVAEADAAALPPLSLLDEASRGPAGLLVCCRDAQAMLALAAQFGRQQAAVLHLAHDGNYTGGAAAGMAGDAALARALLPRLERMADRIAINTLDAPPAWHPAAASAAIERFLRPVTYQDAPAFLLPAALQDDNPLRLWRQVDGALRH
jgi:NADP-dependent aldehyde dehydrogenase